MRAGGGRFRKFRKGRMVDKRGKARYNGTDGTLMFSGQERMCLPMKSYRKELSSRCDLINITPQVREAMLESGI